MERDVGVAEGTRVGVAVTMIGVGVSAAIIRPSTVEVGTGVGF